MGIGTSSPSALFAINALNSSNQADNLFYIGSSTQNTFVIDNHGNIGIGTSTRSGSKARLAITGFGTGTNRILALADANNNEVLTVQENGNVGIGTVPESRLHVVGSSGTTLDISADGTVVGFRSGGVAQGNISISGATVSYNAFTGSHYAWTDEEIERGMLVSMTGNNRYNHDNPRSEIIYGITKSTIPNDPKVLGAYLSLQEPTKPSATSSNPHLVMAVGNGDMWVVDMGKNLEAGDYLISSAVHGHAMKENGSYSPAYVIARAAEPVDWSAVAQTINDNGTERKHKKISILFESYKLYGTLDVNAQMANGEINGWSINQQTGRLTTSYGLDLGGNSIQNVSAIMSASGNWRVDENGELIVKKVKVKEIETEKLKTEKGVTMRDRSTGDYYCVYVDSGITRTEQGECGASVESSAPPPASELDTARSTP